MKKLLISLSGSLLLLLTLTGCGPVKLEMVEEVKPNETAFLVNLEDDSQGKFESVNYLETKKVASKRILLPQRQQSTGRMPWSFRYIPTARVIKVDRSLVSRKWTGDPTTPNLTPEIAPLEVESLDSIGFAIGVTLTARIDEKDAASFLYYHAGKQLSEVIDTNIKSFVLARLSEEFGAIPLTDCRKQKSSVFNRIEAETISFFKQKGITIEYMGLSEGLTYLNPNIQDAIDRSFVAQQEKVTAEQERQAQLIQNQTLISKVTAESRAANELAKNLSAALAKQRIEIELTRVKALATMAEKWNGELPSNVIPSDNPFMGMFFGATGKS